MSTDMYEGAGLRSASDPARVYATQGYVDEDGVYKRDMGRTKQEFKDDADINKIVHGIMKSGASDWLERHDEWLKQVGDVVVPNIEYKELMDIVTDADRKFAELPAIVRAGFQNDPAVFLDFVQSEGGDVELTELVAKAIPTRRSSSVMGAAEANTPDTPAAIAAAIADPASGDG